jgi:hypothetical protein
VNASGKAKLSPLTKTVVRARSDRDMEDSLMSKNKRLWPRSLGLRTTVSSPKDSPYAQALPLKLNKSCGIGTP